MAGSAAAAHAADHSKGDGAADAAPKKGGKGKLILLALPLLLIAAGAGLWFTGILPGLLGMEEKHEEAEAGHPAAPPPPKPAFYAMPELVVNLNAGPRRQSFLKLSIKLEVADEGTLADVQTAQPRLQDLFTTYLREMRPEELRGSAGTHRLREELIGRANLAVAPARITDILFTEMLVQ